MHKQRSLAESWKSRVLIFNKHDVFMIDFMHTINLIQATPTKTIEVPIYVSIIQCDSFSVVLLANAKNTKKVIYWDNENIDDIKIKVQR